MQRRHLLRALKRALKDLLAGNTTAAQARIEYALRRCSNPAVTGELLDVVDELMYGDPDTAAICIADVMDGWLPATA